MTKEEAKISVSYEQDIDKLTDCEFFNFRMELINVKRETLLYVLTEMKNSIEKLPEAKKKD